MNERSLKNAKNRGVIVGDENVRMAHRFDPGADEWTDSWDKDQPHSMDAICERIRLHSQL